MATGRMAEEIEVRTCGEEGLRGGQFGDETDAPRPFGAAGYGSERTRDL